MRRICGCPEGPLRGVLGGNHQSEFQCLVVVNRKAPQAINEFEQLLRVS